MRIILVLAAALVVSSPALAQNASTPVSASAAKKAHYLAIQGGGGSDIDHINVGPNDTISSVVIIFDQRFVNVPGSTISAGDKPGRLKTSLTEKDLRKLP